MGTPYQGDIIRNLLYHIFPTKGKGCWEWNVSQLLRRIDQFNGQRVVSIVTDETTDDFHAVVAAFKDVKKIDFYHYRNDKTLGETVTFESMLNRVENIDPRQITFYGHAKGVKYTADTKHMVHKWAEVMYSNMLDYKSLIEDSLVDKTFVGTFLKSGSCFRDLPAAWHFAGTYFWFRNCKVFDKGNWRHIPRQWWGTEAWPGIVCPKEEADCFLMPGDAPSMQLYQNDYWQKNVNKVWQDWQIKHANLRQWCSISEVANSLRTKRIVVAGPQRSGTTIAAKMLARDLGLPSINELTFQTHNFENFMLTLRSLPLGHVIQAPTMSPYLHLLPESVEVVWMRRNIQDVLRSQKRIGWEQHEQLERDRYFDHTKRPAHTIKTEAWNNFQRIALGERAFDLDYESLKSHRLWVDPEKRKAFSPRQTTPYQGQ